MVGGLAFVARSGWRFLNLLAAFIVVSFLVVAGFAAYAMTLGFGGGGTSYTDEPTRDDVWKESAGGIDWFDGVFDDGGKSDEPLPLTPKQPPSDAQSTIVRNYFPETWYWNPCLVTGEDGTASVSLTAPDSITSWNVSVMASTKDGLIGSGAGSVLVFQPFFVDPDIPVSVVRNDTFPLKVQVYNYLGSPQDVTVTLTEEPWFTLLSPSSQSVSVPTDYVSSVTFYIRASEVGWHTVKIDADASGVSDAVAKPMRVVPDGMKVETLFNGQVENGNATSTLLLDPARIEGAENAWVKLQGGMEAVLLEGVEAFIQFVTGCGEQSLSMLSIDILAYDTVQRLGSSPERLFEFETMVNQGIQHELMYLVKPDNGIGRGIVWFPGDRDAHPWLTSWGLVAFQDAVNAGFGLDEKIISDMQAWLLSIQDRDGSWEFPDWGIYEFNNPILKAKEIAATAYIARALMYSGIPSSSHEIVAAVEYIEDHVSEVWEDSYSLALSLIVLQKGGGSISLRAEAAAQLDSLKQELNGTYYWNSDTNMISDNGFGGARVDMWGGASCTRVIETTGYAAMALHGEGTYLSVVDGAVKYLLDHRQSLGGWYSTQDTIVAFHALNTVTGSPMIEDIVARVYADGVEVFEVQMDEFNRDVTYYVDLRPYLGSVTNVSVSASGSGTLLYSVYLAQYLPWPDELPSNPYLTLEVTYDATHIEITDSVTAHMYLLYSGPAPALRMILVDLRAPMGLSFVLQEFDSLREAGVISSYDSNDRQVVVYIMDVMSGTPVEFDYSLAPQMIITSTVQDMSAWDMYDPDAMRSELEPEEFEVY
jgi:CD109 antigen